MPTLAPAVANEPVSARTCSSIASDTVPIGIRVSNAIASIRATSGCRRNVPYVARAARSTRLINHLDVFRRQPLAQALDQGVVGRHAPAFRQLDLAVDALVRIADRDGQRSGAERTEDLLEAIGGRVAVAGDAKAARPALADR